MQMMKVIHETIPHRPGTSLFCLDQTVPRFNCPYHRHPEMEIVRIDESEGHVLTGDRTSRFRAGDLFVFAGNLPHAFFNDPGTRKARSRCLQFKAEHLTASAEIWPELASTTMIEPSASRGLLLQDAVAEEASARLDKVFECGGLAQISAFLNLLACIQDLEDSNFLTSSSYNPSLSDKGLARLDRVLAYLHSHLTESVPVDRMAGIAGLSVSAFHRLFQQRMGRAPLRYHLDLRFSHVAHCLIESEDPVTEIAYAAGFNNLSNFNRQFKERFGCSPRDYRNGAGDPPYLPFSTGS